MPYRPVLVRRWWWWSRGTQGQGGCQAAGYSSPGDSLCILHLYTHRCRIQRGPPGEYSIYFWILSILYFCILQWEEKVKTHLQICRLSPENILSKYLKFMFYTFKWIMICLGGHWKIVRMFVKIVVFGSNWQGWWWWWWPCWPTSTWLKLPQVQTKAFRCQ